MEVGLHGSSCCASFAFHLTCYDPRPACLAAMPHAALPLDALLACPKHAHAGGIDDDAESAGAPGASHAEEPNQVRPALVLSAVSMHGWSACQRLGWPARVAHLMASASYPPYPSLEGGAPAHSPLCFPSTRVQELADAGMVLRDPSTFHLILHHVSSGWQRFSCLTSLLWLSLRHGCPIQRVQCNPARAHVLRIRCRGKLAALLCDHPAATAQRCTRLPCRSSAG